MWNTPVKILATDLDRTLLPNGRWPCDKGAIDMFNELTEINHVYVVYVTGRNLRLSEDAIQQYGIRHPHILIGDVGTSIREYDDGVWNPYEGWEELVEKSSPCWDAEAVRTAVKDVDGLVEQDREHCGPLKQSFFVDHGNSEAILKKVDERVRGKYDEVIVYSYDSQSGKGLLDLLPASATKQTALEFVAMKMSAEKENVVFCGDSGNDLFPLTAGFSGVMVRNADGQLVARVQQAKEEDPRIRIYHAMGGFRNLNGYYASGVIEGAYHYGLFND